MYRVRAVLSAGVVAAVLLGNAAGAYASTADGDWYYDGLDEIHERADGTGIQVAIIDSQVDSSVPELANADLHMPDHTYCWDQDHNVLPAPLEGAVMQHGTSMAAIIAGSGAGISGGEGIKGVAPGVSLYSYPLVFSTDITEAQNCDFANEQGLAADEWAFRDALDQGVDIINISARIGIRDELMAEAVASGVIVVASSGNDGVSVVGGPANMNGVVATGSYNSERIVSDFNGYGPEMGVVAPGEDVRIYSADLTGYEVGDGTSMATAYTSGALAVAWSAFPEATANQILQLLVHNTGSAGDTHDPERDEVVGFGSVNIESMLNDDPSKYDDENPFVTGDNANGPSVDMIESFRNESATATNTPSQVSTTATASGPVEQDASALPAGVVIGVVIAVIVLMVALVVVVVVVRHRAVKTVSDVSQGRMGR